MASNWQDTSLSPPTATVGPGVNNSVTINAAAGGAAQVLIGDGAAYKLTLNGETLLYGAFQVKAGGLTLGANAAAALYAGSTLSIAGNAFLGYNSNVWLNGGAMTVTGTLRASTYLNSLNTLDSPGINVIKNGGSLTVGALTGFNSRFAAVANSALTVTGGASDLNSAGSLYEIDASTFNVGGAFVTSNDAIVARNGGRVQIAAGIREDANHYGVFLQADSLSSIEIGADGGAALGAVTIDAGKTITEQGVFDAPQVIVKGQLNVDGGGSLSVTGNLALVGNVGIGAGGYLQTAGLSGAGKVVINGAATLDVYNNNIAGTAGPKILFSASPGGMLRLEGNNLDGQNTFAPTIYGMNAAQVIQVVDPGHLITRASYSAGKLNLYQGDDIVETLKLAGNYLDRFSVLPVFGTYYTQIDYLGGGLAVAPAGTATQDNYVWTGPVSGNWNQAANWQDTSLTPPTATTGPGVDDNVTINAAGASKAQVIIGNGAALSLNVNGETLLYGTYQVKSGGLNLGDHASVALYGGSTMTVAGNANFSAYSNVWLNGGVMTVGGAFNANIRDFNYQAEVGVNAIKNGGKLTVGRIVGSNSRFQVGANGALAVNGSVTDAGFASSVYQADGASASITVGGAFVSSNDYVGALNGGKVRLTSLVEDAGRNGVYLHTDANSSLEIGSAGGAALGAITIDAGKVVTEWGSFEAPQTIVKGQLNVDAGKTLDMNGGLTTTGIVNIGAGATLQTGALTGAGKIIIGGAATLDVYNDSIGTADPKIYFSANPGGLLRLEGNDLDIYNTFQPTIYGFGSTQLIQVMDQGHLITRASYSAGKLNLYQGDDLVETLKLSGNYLDRFSVLPVFGTNYTQIDYLGGALAAAPVGTATQDNYVWTGPVAGNWNQAANWQDTSLTPPTATTGPGFDDNVAINAAGYAKAQVVIGNGNALSLTLNGETLLNGIFQVKAGGLTIANNASAALYANSALTVAGDAHVGDYAHVWLNGGIMNVSGAFYANSRDFSYQAEVGVNAVKNGGSLTVGSIVGNSSGFAVGAGSTLTVKGAASDAGNASLYQAIGAGASIKVLGGFVSSGDAVQAQTGGKVQFATLSTDANSNGVWLQTDSASSIEIGTAGGAALGSITIDAGKTVTESGSFQGMVINNGLLNVSANRSLEIYGDLNLNGNIVIGANAALYTRQVTGAGRITIGAGSVLSMSDDALGGATPVYFSGAGGVLALDRTDLDGSNAIAPVINGFGTQQTIQFQDSVDTITSAHYSAGKLKLYDGANVVASLNLAGVYNDYFSVAPLVGSNVWQINYYFRAPATAPAGTLARNDYLWNGPLTGFWNQASSWKNTSLSPPTAAVGPGVNDYVTVGAAANGAAQVLVGNGAAYGLSLLGTTALKGAFNVVGQDASGGLNVASRASLALSAGDTLTVAGDANFDWGSDAQLLGGALTVNGALYAANVDVAHGRNRIVRNGSLTAAQLIGDDSVFDIASGGSLLVTGQAQDVAYYHASQYHLDGGAMTVQGAFVSGGDSLSLSNGASAQLAALQEDLSGGSIYVSVDGTSALEIGTAGGAALGAITIDAGESVTENGQFTAPSIVVNGALAVGDGQTLSLYGQATGPGQISIGANSTLGVDGIDSASTATFDFAGAGGTLMITGFHGLPGAATLTGFAPGENLEVMNVTDATYENGKLVFSNNGVDVGAFVVGTGYLGSAFDVTPLSNGFSQVTLGPSWQGPVSGDFSDGSLWSTGVAPSAADSVAVSVPGTYTVSITSPTTIRSLQETNNTATVDIAADDSLTVSGMSNINGALTGGGAFVQTAGRVTFDGQGSITTSAWNVSGAGTQIELDQTLSYIGAFTADAGSLFTLAGGDLTLAGATSLTDATLAGGHTLFTEAATSLSGLTIGETTVFANEGALTQSGADVLIGDGSASLAQLDNTSTASWTLADDSDLRLGAGSTSTIKNSGVLQKTGGGGPSVVEAAVANTGTLSAASGTLDFQAAVTGAGFATVSNGATLQFDAGVDAGQQVNYLGAGQVFIGDLTDFHARLGGFAASDTIALTGAWTLSNVAASGGATTLTLSDGAQSLGLLLAGTYVTSDFQVSTGGTTYIAHS